jgi:hypothetical protein
MPPSVGGWDTESALSDMPAENAVILDNWFPETDAITLRRGSEDHLTDLPDTVESLIEYTPEDGDGELYAASDGGIYDATAAGTAGAAVASGFSNDRFQSAQIGTSGGHFVLAMNGADTPVTYDGSSWANSSIVGPTLANLIWCNHHQDRLFIGETDTLDFWYLPVNSITGTAVRFPLLASKGGYVMAMGTWTRDAGDGADDVAVFVTSQGQAIVYQGTDPNSVTTWSRVGTFNIGKPIGRRCLIKYGGDLVIVTEDGFISVETMLSKDRAETARRAISAQINRAVNDATRLYGSLFGWEPFIYYKGAMILFNVPQSSSTAHQYVFSTITGKPCRFTGLNALCWALMNDEAYFGTADGRVVKFDTGTSDSDVAIAGDVLPAFSYFGSKDRVKAFRKAQPIFRSSGNPTPALDLNLEFQITAPSAVATPLPASAAKWGVAKWGVAKWGSSNLIFKGWRGLRGIGRAASLRIRVNTTSARPSLIATDFIFDKGGVL